MKYSAVFSSFLLSFYSVGALAAPIESDHLIEILQIGNVADAYHDYSTDSYFQNTFSTGVEAYADLTTGEVGSSSENVRVNSIARIFDTLAFDAAGEVSFSYSIDGVFSSTGPNSYAAALVGIFDITGLDNWLVEGDLWGIPLVSTSPEAQSILDHYVHFNMNRTNVYRNNDLESTTITNLSRDGALHEVAYDLNGSFMADASKLYGISLFVNTYAGGSGSVANFLNTGTFAFTDLGGTSFTSGSGTFLSAQQSATAVPEPSTIALLGLGLIALFFKSFRKFRLGL